MAKARIYLRVLQKDDGYAVGVFGEVGGYLSTIARGLTAEEAHIRASQEAAERGLEVRRD